MYIVKTLITTTYSVIEFLKHNLRIYRTKLVALSINTVVNAKALSIMRYQDDINTEHNRKSIGRAAVAQSQCAWLSMDKREFESERRTFLILQYLVMTNVMIFFTDDLSIRL